MMFGNLWDTAKAVVRSLQQYNLTSGKKQEKSQINNLTLHLNKNKQNSKLVEGKKSQKAEQK